MYYVLDGASKRFKTISNFKKVHGKKHLTEPENRIRKYVIQENKENHHCKGLLRGGVVLKLSQRRQDLTRAFYKVWIDFWRYREESRVCKMVPRNSLKRSQV